MALPLTLPDPDRGSPGKWHCPTCEPGTGRATRAKMHCGFIPKKEWPAGRGTIPLAIGDQPYAHDTCPGWVARQPEVEEAAQAYDALEAGILDRFDPLGLHVVTEAAQLARRSFNLHTAERLRQLRKKA